MTSTLIQPRAAWTSNTFGGVPNVPASARTGFAVHYHGLSPCPSRISPDTLRAIDNDHRSRGWAGIGYNLLGGQDGQVFEARGWDKLGAHAGPGNRPDYGFQAHIGGSQRPTDALLRAIRDTYEIACTRSRRRLAMRWHSYWMDTSCPGQHLLAWVKAGMPYPSRKEIIDMKPSDPTSLRDRDGTAVTVGEALPRGAYAYRELEAAGLLTAGALREIVKDVRELSEGYAALKKQLEELKK